MNKIRIGKIIRNFLLIIGFILIAFAIITYYFYEKNIILVLIGVIGAIIMVIGNTIGIFMCRCPKCGELVLGRGLSIHKYCIKCGEKIEY